MSNINLFSSKFWGHIEKRLIERDSLYYVGSTLCVDKEKSMGIALNTDGKGFVYNKYFWLKNTKIYQPDYIFKIVIEIYKESKSNVYAQCNTTIRGFGYLVNAISQNCLCSSCENIGCRGVEIPFKAKWTVHECDGYVKNNF